MAEILIVEDNPEINALIAECLMVRHHCQQVYSGTEAEQFLATRRHEIDLIILDLMLPGRSGEELIRQMRAEPRLPILVISAKDALHNKLDCFRLGADDYLTKPFDIEELEARVDVLLRTHPARAQMPDERALGKTGLSLSAKYHDLIFRGERMHLTRQEYRILLALSQEPEKVFSREELYMAAWDEAYLGDDRALSVHMSNLRRKLREAGAPELIETVWGVGFTLAIE